MYEPTLCETAYFSNFIEIHPRKHDKSNSKLPPSADVILGQKCLQSACPTYFVYFDWLRTCWNGKFICFFRSKVVNIFGPIFQKAKKVLVVCSRFCYFILELIRSLKASSSSLWFPVKWVEPSLWCILLYREMAVVCMYWIRQAHLRPRPKTEARKSLFGLGAKAERPKLMRCISKKRRGPQAASCWKKATSVPYYMFFFGQWKGRCFSLLIFNAYWVMQVLLHCGNKQCLIVSSLIKASLLSKYLNFIKKAGSSKYESCDG